MLRLAAQDDRGATISAPSRPLSAGYRRASGHASAGFLSARNAASIGPKINPAGRVYSLDSGREESSPGPSGNREVLGVSVVSALTDATSNVSGVGSDWA